MLKVYVFSCCVMLVTSENRRQYEERQGKFFTFNVVEEDISVDLDFSIPFIKIPVKKTVNSANGLTEFPTININPASLVLGGAMVLGTTVLISYLMKHYVNHQGDFRYAKLIQKTVWEHRKVKKKTVLDVNGVYFKTKLT